MSETVMMRIFCYGASLLFVSWQNIFTQGAKSLYLAKKRLEVTSPAIVVLNAFLDSSDLPKEALTFQKKV